MKNFFLALFFLIILLAAVPRSVEVLGGNYLFGFDQGLFYQDIKKIVVDHKFTLIGSFSGGQGGLFQGPGWYYILSIPFILWNGDPYGGMVLMLVLGLLTIALSIHLGSKMFDRKTALVIGLLLAVSPALVSQSRFIWPPFPVSLLTVIYLYFIFKFFEGNDKYLLFSTFTIGLISSFELATAGTFLFQLLIFYPFFLLKKLASIKTLILSLLTFALPLSPLIIFNFRHNNILFDGILNITRGGSSHQVTLKYFEYMFLNHLDVFKFNFLSSFNQSGVLWIVILVFLVFGGLFYLKNKRIKTNKKLFMVYLLTGPLILFAVFMFYLWPIWEWWILELTIFYLFAFGILSVYFWKNNFLRIGIAAIYLIFILSFSVQTAGFYKNDLRDYGGTAKIKGKLDAIDYIYKDAKGEKFGLLIFTPPVYTFAYDYLLWWHGQRKYDYIPSSSKDGIFYLLIEPDPHKPWTYKGWLETVIKSGKIVKTIELPSGFIIEKRVL